MMKKPETQAWKKSQSETADTFKGVPFYEN
jgi:hypothetical protein